MFWPSCPFILLCRPPAIGFRFNPLILWNASLASFADSRWPAAGTLLRRPEWHAEAAQQCARFVIILRGCHNRDIHAFLLIHLGVIDLRENQLVAQSQRVIAAAIKRLGG